MRWQDRNQAKMAKYESLPIERHQLERTNLHGANPTAGLICFSILVTWSHISTCTKSVAACLWMAYFTVLK
jgi:hypothetical protein